MRHFCIATHNNSIHKMSKSTLQVSITCCLSLYSHVRKMAVSNVKRKLWCKESMLEAVKSIEDEGKGLREASRIYNVPVETLRRRVIGITSLDAKPGRDTVLTSEEETRLAQYIVDMCDMGFGLTRRDVMRVAYSIVEKSGREHPFSNGMAGRAWSDPAILTLPCVFHNHSLTAELLLLTKTLLMISLPKWEQFMLV